MATIEEDLNQLEKDIRQLRIEYDSYFAGGRPRPPSDIEWRVSNIIKKHASGRMSFSHRFRYDGLVQRYAKFSELWRQRTRQKEAGLSPYLAAGQAAREAARLETARAETLREEAARAAKPARAVAEKRFVYTDPRREPEKVQELYRTLVAAKEKAGEKADVNFEQFHRFVRQKTDELKKQLGCQQVEYSVSVEGGQVKLKAKGK